MVLAVAAAVLALLFHAVVAEAGAGGIQVVEHRAAHRGAQRSRGAGRVVQRLLSVLPARATRSVLSAISQHRGVGPVVQQRVVQHDHRAALPQLRHPLAHARGAQQIRRGAVGAAMACCDEPVSYAKQREMLGRPLGSTQIQQVRLAEMLTEITKAQLPAWRLGNLKEQGTMRPEQVSLAKRNNLNMACDVAREARRLLGGNGILIACQSMRHMANLESVRTCEVTHDVHGLILGQDITGFAAY